MTPYDRKKCTFSSAFLELRRLISGLQFAQTYSMETRPIFYLVLLGILSSCVTLEDERSFVDDHNHADSIGQIAPETLEPYRENGPYAHVLVECIYPKKLGQNCPLDKLPLLYHDTPHPTVDDILDRLVISKRHPWLATNFRFFLESAPEGMLDLFSSVTAIVIADKISRSIVHSYTGAMYLAPFKNLWLSVAERESLTPEIYVDKDYGLLFDSTWWYHIDGESWLKKHQETNLERQRDQL